MVVAVYSSLCNDSCLFVYVVKYIKHVYSITLYNIMCPCMDECVWRKCVCFSMQRICWEFNQIYGDLIFVEAFSN